MPTWITNRSLKISNSLASGVVERAIPELEAASILAMAGKRRKSALFARFLSVPPNASTAIPVFTCFTSAENFLIRAILMLTRLQLFVVTLIVLILRGEGNALMKTEMPLFLLYAVLESLSQ